ncbi:MAG: pyridoxal phosphate-dependent aminotransferase [Ferroplasma sp.]|uniref:pyridoxal phosphate-dependent aminotransferase n=1 Tax=Ferroplasma sp. TaxID=2591003 RepID=UPI002815FEF8|nr:pyridoxal phosphate-dependent aminotransferase [Ferroplasma sp.]WMT52188.1 MAG: pyridoxal phosphate-dependent aminotransferase [Ferroplasma sp.]
MECETISWLNQHHGKYELSHSGMSNVFNLKEYLSNSPEKSDIDLKEEIAGLHGCSPKQVVITHGATEAFSMVLFHLAGKYRSFSVNRPEYEMIYKTPGILGFRNGEEVFTASNPNNPTGTMAKLPEKYESAVIDETFMEFIDTLDHYTYRNGFIVNTFTKVYGGGDLRLGYIVAPMEEDAVALEGFKGLITEDVSVLNISAGYHVLKKHDELLQQVRSIIGENHRVLVKNKGKLKFFQGKTPLPLPVSFMDYSEYTERDSDTISEKLAEKGIIALPARYFGISGTYLRICITGKDFPEAYSQLIGALENME